MSAPTSSASLPVSAFLASVSLAPRQSHKLLTVWPLRRTAGAASPRYDLLADALARGEAVIEERKSGATVPHVLVSNRGDVAVLVLFGEEIRGALQNRTANASFLIPARGQVEIDVSCVEQGRWSSRSSLRFGESGGVVASALRAKMATKVAASRSRGRGFLADQGEVWDEVSSRVLAAGARSATGAYADYVASRRRDLDEASAAFSVVPDQVGFLAAIGDEVVGLEAIGRPEVFARAFASLLRAYLVDAIDAAVVRARPAAHGEPESAARPAPLDSPEAFLDALARASATASPSLGLGTDVRLAGERACGCALVQDEVVHLTAFPAVAR